MGRIGGVSLTVMETVAVLLGVPSASSTWYWKEARVVSLPSWVKVKVWSPLSLTPYAPTIMTNGFASAWPCTRPIHLKGCSPNGRDGRCRAL